MTYNPDARFLLNVFSQVVNTFIQSPGGDPLLGQSHRLLGPSLSQPNGFSFVIPIILGMVVTELTHYVLGHVVMSVLIVERAEVHRTSPHGTESKRTPSCRRLMPTLSTLYQTGGIRYLFSGFRTAIVYWISRGSITSLLKFLIFRHAYLEPLAHVFSSVLVAESHYFWTAGTLLVSPNQIDDAARRRDWGRWKTLAIPTMFHAMAETLMNYIPSMVEDFNDPTSDNASTTTKSIIMSDILVLILMTALLLFALFPSRIILISTEASFLPKTCETIIPSSNRRGLRVGELFQTSAVPLNAQRAYQMLSVARLQWCLELHGKMCLWLLCVGFVVNLSVSSLL